jgi:hypothetical protein
MPSIGFAAARNPDRVFSVITAEISITRALRSLQRGDSIPIGLDRDREARHRDQPRPSRRYLVSEEGTERSVRVIADAEGIDAMIVNRTVIRRESKDQVAARRLIAG